MSRVLITLRAAGHSLMVAPDEMGPFLAVVWRALLALGAVLYVLCRFFPAEPALSGSP